MWILKTRKLSVNNVESKVEIIFGKGIEKEICTKIDFFNTILIYFDTKQ